MKVTMNMYEYRTRSQHQATPVSHDNQVISLWSIRTMKK